MTASLVFQNTIFDITDRNGQPWLKAGQIGAALGYTDDKSIVRIYARNADEFSEAMSTVVKLTTVTGDKETRIFSLRGAHLLAMLSRTKIAKEFRRWVLDLLDRETVPAAFRPDVTRKALPNGLTVEQCDAVKALHKGRVQALPQAKQAGAAIKLWSCVKAKFGVSYKEVPPESFAEVLSLMARTPLEGELLEPAPHPEAPMFPNGFSYTPCAKDQRFIMNFTKGLLTGCAEMGDRMIAANPETAGGVRFFVDRVPVDIVPALIEAASQRLMGNGQRRLMA